MSLTQEQFASLVTKLEEKSERQPQLYKFRVFLLAALGYAYICLIFLLLLAAIGLFAFLMITDGPHAATIKIGVILIAFSFILARSLWVRFTPPQGIPLQSEHAKTLFLEAEHLRKNLKAPKIHQILLTDDLNAAMVQTPRLGVFGWQTNHLIIGLPLMMSLSPDQFRAIVAHELGHLAGGHSRFGGWIYRIRRSWAQLMMNLEKQNHWGSFIFKRFFTWYVPIFDANSFVLRRANEYEADRASERIVGVKQAGEALIRLNLTNSFLNENFWPGIFKQVETQSEPTAFVYGEMQKALQTVPDPEQARRWLDQALAERTDSSDTHPSLTDRLSALGQIPQIPGPIDESAAEHFFGNSLDGFIDQVSEGWKEAHLASWRERYQELQAEKQRMQELEDKAEKGELSQQEAWERASFIRQNNGAEKALPIYQNMLSQFGDHPAVHYQAGRILLSQNNPDGVYHIEKAMELDEEAVLPGCELLYDYYMSQGLEQNAKEYASRYNSKTKIQQMDEYERSHAQNSDTFGEHCLSDEQIQSITKQLTRYKRLKKAWLVRKVLTNNPQQPAYVLGFSVSRPWYTYYYLPTLFDKKMSSQIAKEVSFPYDTLIIPLNYSRFLVGFKLRKVKKAMIYRRKRWWR